MNTLRIYESNIGKLASNLANSTIFVENKFIARLTISQDKKMK